MNTSAPLYGLVLAGGASTRMHKDKAALTYDDKPQLHVAFGLAAGVCVEAFISVRADQTNDPLRAPLPQIVDQLDGLGPIAGIHAAQALHPHAAWLVIACDLPFLDRATLEYLLGQRDPGRLATAFRSSHDGLPEPLCAIYEPRSREAIAAYIGGGGKCPRKFLIGAGQDVHLADLPRPDALDNINTPGEYTAARQALGRSVKRITVRYHALLREQAGAHEETFETDDATPASLYERLRRKHGFSLDRGRLRVAINAEFSDWDSPLEGGDVVVFIPPVSGG